MMNLNAGWSVTRIAAVLFAVVVCPQLPLCPLGPRPALAQSSEEFAAEKAAQDRLYEEIAVEVAALEKQGNLLKKVVRAAKPSVVHIEARKTAVSSVRGTIRATEEAGSGVIIEHNGRFYVLTNRHVIRDSNLSQIKIELSDGRLTNPTKIWSDSGTDVAVMAVSVPRVIPAKLGDSDSLEIGDFVLAFGSPFGLSHSVTYGIISAKGRHDLKLGDGVKFQNFLQTDAAINPGNSGGPLLNLRGQVVGINTAIASSSGGNDGIGFTIPINMAMYVAKQLIDRGQVTRAYLGVRLDSRFNAAQAAEIGLPRPTGARVSGLTPGSPAEAAKIMPGDVILQINDVRVEDDDHLVNMISVLPVGKEVELLIFRDGKAARLKLKVGDRSQFE